MPWAIDFLDHLQCTTRLSVNICRPGSVSEFKLRLMCVEFENSHPRPLRVGCARSTRIHQGRQFSTRCSRIEWEIGRGEMSEWISQLNFTSFLLRSPITRQFYTRIRILCAAEVREGWRNVRMTKQKVQDVTDVTSKHYLICTIVLMSSTLT